MIKILCLAVLLALTCQLKLDTHEQLNPLAGNSFLTIFNSKRDQKMNNARVDFTADKVSFRSKCGKYTAPYTINATMGIIVERKWIYSKEATCGPNNDDMLKTLFNQSVRYFKTVQMTGYTVDLIDSTGKTLLTLKKL